MSAGDVRSRAHECTLLKSLFATRIQFVPDHDGGERATYVKLVTGHYQRYDDDTDTTTLRKFPQALALPELPDGSNMPYDVISTQRDHVFLRDPRSGACAIYHLDGGCWVLVRETPHTPQTT